MSAPGARRFLHLTPILPATRGNGLAMRAGMFTQALARLGPTTVVVVGDDRPFDIDPALGDVTVERVPVAGRADTRLRLIRAIADPTARARALLEYGRPARTAMLSAPVLADVRDRVAGTEWSAVVMSRAHLLPIVEAADALSAGTPLLLDLDDDDGDLLREQVALAGEGGKAAWLETEAELVDRMIARNAPRVRAFTCASDASVDSLRRRLALPGLRSVPNGVELTEQGAGRERAASRLLFVGNLSYQPNVDGIAWFIRYVWPRLRAEIPSVELVVAGSDPADPVRELCAAPGITLIANPPDLAPLYARATASIVPLRLGSGSRIKILEAGARGVPVVSTRKGCEGIDLDADRDLFVADADAESFAQACLSCLENPEEAKWRAASLRRLVEERYDRDRIVGDISRLVRSMLH